MKKLYTLFIFLFVFNCGISQDCPPGGGEPFRTQEQIDNFRIDYPHCTHLDAGIWIGFGDTSKIMNLHGLSNITSIDGDLLIIRNYNLKNLEGLNNLQSIGGDIWLSYNFSLNSIEALSSLTSIGGQIYINDSPFLQNLSGLENIDAATITDIELFRNFSLCYCHVKSICDYLENNDNPNLFYYNATGCNSKEEVQEACEMLTCLPDGITFMTQAEIDNFQTNYPSCIEIEGNVIIQNTERNNITNLNGLNVLTSIGGLLEISGNSALTSLAGLNNIAGNSITSLKVFNNSSLSTCEVKSVCDYLASPAAEIEIHDNATGCNSEDEVAEACKLGLDEKNISENHLHIYPNPSSTSITISTPMTSQKNRFLTIININGQVLKMQLISKEKTLIDISGLSSGVYFAKVADDMTVMVGKFVKQ